MDAIFGAPDAPKGTVAFTIENSVNVRDAKLLGEEHIIIEDNYTIPILDKSKGKVVPFVFGELGTSSREQAGSISIETDLRATPAYQAGGTATLKTQYFQVATIKS